MTRVISAILAAALLALVFIPLNSQPAQAATTKTIQQKVSAKALQNGLQFFLTNMPYNGPDSLKPDNYSGPLTYRGIQNFDYTPDGKYILAMGECVEGSKVHSLLTRCRIPEERGETASAECEQAILLKGFGHGDSIAVTQDNLKKEVYNIWVSCKPGLDGYSREIARLTYKVDKNGKGKITKTVYITNFQKAATKKGKATFFDGKVTPVWTQVAVDTSSNQVVFRLAMPAGYSVHYVSYNYKKLNAALDKIGNKKSYDIAKAAKLQMADVQYGETPLMSFQSFDVQGKCLYLAGGNLGLGTEIYALTYKTQASGKVKLQNKDQAAATKIVTVGSKIKIYDAEYDKDYLEVEGLKVEKGKNGKMNYYLNFHCEIPSIKDSTGIYKISK